MRHHRRRNQAGAVITLVPMTGTRKSGVTAMGSSTKEVAASIGGQRWVVGPRAERTRGLPRMLPRPTGSRIGHHRGLGSE